MSDKFASSLGGPQLLDYPKFNSMKAIYILSLFFLTSCSGPSPEEFTAARIKREAENNKLMEDNKRYSPMVLSSEFSFKSIELVYVQVGPIYYSWLGHVLMRFEGSGKTPDEDITLSFLPMIDVPIMDMIKGFYGHYIIFPVIKPWKEYLDQYVQKEERYIDRHEIAATLEQKEKLKQVLKSWVARPTTTGPFSFRRKNCTYWQLKILKEAGLPVNDNLVFFPVDLFEYLKKENLISKSHPRIMPLKADFQNTLGKK